MPPFLHCVQRKILVFAIPIRHFDGRNFELGPTQWSQLHVVHIGVSRHVRGQTWCYHFTNGGDGPTRGARRFKSATLMGTGKKGGRKFLTESLEKKLTESRKWVKKMKLKQCVDDFEEMKKKRSGSWESPQVEVMKLNVFFFFFKYIFFFSFNFKIIKKKIAKIALFQQHLTEL